MCTQIGEHVTTAKRKEPGALLTTLLFWQHTAVAEQELLPPTPMTEMGEHERPTRTFRSWRTMPSSPRIAAAPESLACMMNSG